MQIVIDIDEYEYKRVNELVSSGLFDYEGITAHLFKRVANGVPLPKGHGRLIDADVFEKRLMNASLYYRGEKADIFDLRFAAGLDSAAERLVSAPTIIEADKGE